MSSDVFERRMNYTALLGSLLNLYIGPMTLKIDSARAGGLTFISKRTNVPVRHLPLPKWVLFAVYDLLHLLHTLLQHDFLHYVCRPCTLCTL